MKRAERRKRYTIIAICVTVLFLACAGAAISGLHKADVHPPESPSQETIENIDDPVTPEPAQELRGTVKDVTANTLTVQGEDNREYCFRTDGVSISTGETGTAVGNPVTVTYYGKLDPTVSAQDIELVSITVTDAIPATEGPEPPPDEPPESTAPDAPPPTPAQRAQELLDTMTLEEKVGQMFIARCPDTDAAGKAEKYSLGGYILFGRDFSGKTKDEVIDDIQSYQNAVKNPMFIAVDEEGGTVNRVSRNRELRSAPFLSPQKLYARGGFDLIRSDTQEKCELLRSLGINLNFAPVCDVSQDPKDFIYARSFGQDAEQTAAYIRLVVDTMSQEGMGSVLKHFPGYGSNADTHTGIAYDDRPYETFLSSDFLPFKAGIEAGAGIVLVSHNVVSCMDGGSPASLSPQVHKILREELGFTGVIVTDDLAMDGVADFADDTETAVRAVTAGNDLLCSTDFEVQIPAVVEAVRQGEIAEERNDGSVLRILELKISLGIL